MESQGLASMMYNNGQGNSIKHYYTGAGKTVKQKKKTTQTKKGK